jgi:hypothetical protein
MCTLLSIFTRQKSRLSAPDPIGCFLEEATGPDSAAFIVTSIVSEGSAFQRRFPNRTFSLSDQTCPNEYHRLIAQIL